MSKCDFKFRDETLSSHGYMLCEFDGSRSVETVPTDSQREITSIPMFGGKYFPIVSSIYSSAFVAEMNICKIDDSEGHIISTSEVVGLKRWLGSPTPAKFSLLDGEYAEVFWNGTFNIEELHIDGDCVGLHLTFTATTPFGYKSDVVLKGSVEKSGSIDIYDTSDEEGYLYPDMTITLKEAGDLRISNAFDGRVTLVKNCKSGETIYFSRFLQAKSSDGTHAIGDDFNYKFLRINNTYGNVVNKITFSLSCNYSISYNPIAKVVI